VARLALGHRSTMDGMEGTEVWVDTSSIHSPEACKQTKRCYGMNKAGNMMDIRPLRWLQPRYQLVQWWK